MDKQEIWDARVRSWQASGKSLSEFSRDREFTASGLSYWVRRLGAREPAPRSAKSVRLARVVRTERTDLPSVASAPAPTACLVVEAGPLRVQVPGDIEVVRLQAVLMAIGCASKAVQV